MSNFIAESPLLQEAKILKIEPTRAIFRCVIQTGDEINRNKRMYPKSVLEQGMDDRKHQMRTKSFMGELDHPLPSGAAQADTMRQTTVLLKEVSHYIKDYEWQGNKLIGDMETATTPNGKTLLALLRDKSTIGFSMRGLAELERHKDHSVVKGPCTILSYDAVSTPSHSGAIVSFNEMVFENTLFESNGSITTESCNIQEGKNTVCFNGQCYLVEYFDKLVDTGVINFFKRWV